MFAKLDKNYPSQSGQTNLATAVIEISPNVLQILISGPVELDRTT